MPPALRALLVLPAAVAGAGAGVLGRPGAAAAAIGWLVAVLVLASRRPEGDLVVPGSVAGYVWLLGGTLLAGVCVALPYSGARAEGR